MSVQPVDVCRSWKNYSKISHFCYILSTFLMILRVLVEKCPWILKILLNWIKKFEELNILYKCLRTNWTCLQCPFHLPESVLQFLFSLSFFEIPNIKKNRQSNALSNSFFIIKCILTCFRLRKNSYEKYWNMNCWVFSRFPRLF